jgi:RNA polymerase sigma-70 factor (ECF subfamily)
LRKKKNDVPIEEYEAAASSAQPDEAVISAEFMAGLKAAVADLPPDFKNVLILKDLEHRKYEEIAGILEISEGTVKSRLFRAREKLRKLMEKRQLL